MVVNGTDSFDSFLTFALSSGRDFANLSNKEDIFLVLKFKAISMIIHFFKCRNK